MFKKPQEKEITDKKTVEVVNIEPTTEKGQKETKEVREVVIKPKYDPNLSSEEEISALLEEEDEEIEEIKPLADIINESIAEAVEEDKAEQKAMNLSYENAGITELKEMNTQILKECVEVVKIGREILETDLEHTKQYADILKHNIEVQKENYEINKKLDKFNLKYMGLYMAVGGLVVYLFPKVLPYIEKTIDFVRG